jgi:hypothetical protein
MHFTLIYEHSRTNTISLELRREVMQIHERKFQQTLEADPELSMGVNTLTPLFAKGVASMPELISQ